MSKYGKHLRAVVDSVRNGPLDEHRALCTCKRCKKARKT